MEIYYMFMNLLQSEIKVLVFVLNYINAYKL